MTNVPLSPSRVKTLKECSWIYYCNYKLRLPDKGNSGASMGTICHMVFELLGDPRHKHVYDLLIKEGNAYAYKPLDRLIRYHAVKLKVDEEQFYDKMDEMIMMGLRYDFFGESFGDDVEVLSEIGFDIEEIRDGINYRIRGFIDKLFLIKQRFMQVVRDFKSSKKVFEGEDLYFNLQHYMYTLAAKHLYPDMVKRQMEFLFLQHHNVVMDEIAESELEGLEHYLTQIQQIVNNFDEKSAKENFAFDQGWPKDNSFSGKVKCGRNTHAGQLKKDGTLMWGCSYKWPFDYYEVLNEKGEVVNTIFEEEYEESKKIYPEHVFFKRHYSGCPKWN